MTKKITKLVLLLAVLAAIGWGMYKIATAPKIATTDIVQNSGTLHWHAHLSIRIHGQEVVVPANIGVNGPMGAGGDPMQLHTHDTDGIIHAEFEGLVTKDQLKLSNFFKVWGKDFSKDSILGYTNGNDGAVHMTVNGLPNTDFENYVITGKGTYDAGELGKIDDIVITFD